LLGLERQLSGGTLRSSRVRGLSASVRSLRVASFEVRRPTNQRGKDDKDFCSFAFAGLFARSLKLAHHALKPNGREQARTPALNRQAGGHWFEPSTAHLGANS
jgi:hypothetical protein